MFVLCILTYSELTYEFADHVYQYPQWAVGIGWTMASVPIFMVPIVMLYKLATTKGTLREVGTLCFCSFKIINVIHNTTMKISNFTPYFKELVTTVEILAKIALV